MPAIGCLSLATADERGVAATTRIARRVRGGVFRPRTLRRRPDPTQETELRPLADLSSAREHASGVSLCALETVMDWVMLR
jgi:hypothetical protein